MIEGGTMPEAQMAAKVCRRLNGFAGRFGLMAGARDHFVELRFADNVASEPVS